MIDLVLDASFALRWCFEDEATVGTEALLTQLQNQERTAFVPGIWPYEILNALGKGVTRGRIEKANAISLWQECRNYRCGKWKCRSMKNFLSWRSRTTSHFTMRAT